jgi:DNA-binding response OmpR family regulator
MGATRILVVDDDDWTLQMVKTVLTKKGYEVETAMDGTEALEKAMANPPGLIISDVVMPKMDGWALVKALRSRAQFAFVPVVFLTAASSEENRIQGFRLGADDFLAKPFRFEELELRVERSLERRAKVERKTRDTLSGEGGANLRGGLDQVSLPALLTMLEMEKKTGVLVVRHQDEKKTETGRLYIRDGRVIRARLDDKRKPDNAECVYYLLEWPGGQFSFSATKVEEEDQINQSTSFLLMEGARIIDEKNAGGVSN